MSSVMPTQCKVLTNTVLCGHICHLSDCVGFSV